MNAFLQELGRKLADRWLTLLVLPGLLWCGALLAADALGHAHAVDVARFVHELASRITRIQHRGAAGIGVLLATLALAASAAGMGARLLGGATRRAWLGQWPGWSEPLRTKLVERRGSRWQAHADDYAAGVHAGAETAALDSLAARRNAIALAPPARPTWIGDRIAAVDARVLAQYELDLGSAWPRLWLLLPDNTRADLRTASTSFEAASTLAGWAVLYACGGIAWWPALVIGIACLLAAIARARTSVATLADLVEASVDLYGPDLCVALHVTESAEPLTPELGRRVSRQLRKGA